MILSWTHLDQLRLIVRHQPHPTSSTNRNDPHQDHIFVPYHNRPFVTALQITLRIMVNRPTAFLLKAKDGLMIKYLQEIMVQFLKKTKGIIWILLCHQLTRVVLICLLSLTTLRSRLIQGQQSWARAFTRALGIAGLLRMNR
jgi:hypothetical protein